MKLKAFFLLISFIVLLANVSFCQIKEEDLYPSPEELRIFLLENLKYQKAKEEKQVRLMKAISFLVAGLVIPSLIYLCYHSIRVLNKTSSLAKSLSIFFDGFTIRQFYIRPEKKGDSK